MAGSALNARVANQNVENSPFCDESEGQSEAWLQNVMRNERNRATLAALEKVLDNFMQDESVQRLPLPPKSAFFRKVCHAVSLRYRLGHRIEQVPGASADSIRLVLIKTPQSCSPVSRVAEILTPSNGIGEAHGRNSMPRVQAIIDPLTASGSAAAHPSTNTAPVSRSVASDKKLNVRNEEQVCLTSHPNQRSCQASNMCSEGIVNSSTLYEHELRPPTVLRRPMDGQGRRQEVRLGSGSSDALTAVGPAAVKNCSQEEYESVRARIFQRSSGSREVQNDTVGRGNSGSCAERVARGPMEGSVGFESRRRNQPGHGAALTRERSTVVSGMAVVSVASDSALGPRIVRYPQSSGARLGSTGFTVGRGDLIGDQMDPDFDRRYSKWMMAPAVPSAAHASPESRFGTSTLYTPFLGSVSSAHHPEASQLHGYLPRTQVPSVPPLPAPHLPRNMSLPAELNGPFRDNAQPHVVYPGLRSQSVWHPSPLFHLDIPQAELTSQATYSDNDAPSDSRHTVVGVSDDMISPGTASRCWKASSNSFPGHSKRDGTHIVNLERGNATHSGPVPSVGPPALDSLADFPSLASVTKP